MNKGNNKSLLRLKAEEILSKKHSIKKIPSTKEEIEELLHELEICKIQLELQNDELKNDELKNLCDNLPQAIFSFDVTKNRMLQVSVAHENVFGYSPSEFYKNPHLWYELIVPEDRSIVDAGNSVLTSGKILKHQFRINHPNGQVRWIGATMKPTINKNGELIRIDGIASDISERIDAEKKVRRLSQAIELSPVAIFITDPQGNIEYVNPKFCEVSGYTVEESLGRNPRFLQSGERQREVYKELWDSILSGKVWHGEFHNKKKNGELYWVDSRIFSILNEDREILNFVAINEDITEKKKMIVDLITAKEKAEEMNRLKSSFLANMSHELRTPMIGILGYSEILGEDSDNPEIKESASFIKTSAQRLMETLNLILDLSKIESGKLELYISKVDVVKTVQEVIKLYEEAAHKKSISLFMESKFTSVELHLDEKLLWGILNNLVNNAVKFTSHGRVSVEIFQELSSSAVEIKISDTGIGIEKEHLTLIWDEFRQVSEGFGRSFQGTGLGLTISKKFIEKMNGTIDVESKPNVGSVFTLRFPYLTY